MNAQKKIKKNIKEKRLPQKKRFDHHVRVFAFKNFLHYRVKPFLFKLLIIVVVLLVASFLTAKFVFPKKLESLQKGVYTKIGAILANKDEFKDVIIKGNVRVDKERVQDIIAQTIAECTTEQCHHQLLIQNIATRIKQDTRWVDRVVVTRLIPDKLEVTIIEYEPFAVWFHDGKKYVIDKAGSSVQISDSEYESDFAHLVILAGNEANLHTDSLFNILAIDPQFSAQIYSATWVGDRRWDIRLSNGLLIKLPQSNIHRAWSRLLKIHKASNGFYHIVAIDLRLEDRTYVEYDKLESKQKIKN